ncbi:MAG: hypothetical protein KQH63_09095 [Desulfobulbaceae bacterium]|nr:hypothetical protein [Desulfobulbaceae bacterium]
MAKKKLYTDSAGKVVTVVGVLTVIGFVLSVTYIVLGTSWAYYSSISKILGAVWVLGPPVWFWFEHNYFFPRNAHAEATFSDLKSEQDVAGKIWAAFVVILAALFTGSFPK